MVHGIHDIKLNGVRKAEIINRSIVDFAIYQSRLATNFPVPFQISRQVHLEVVAVVQTFPKQYFTVPQLQIEIQGTYSAGEDRDESLIVLPYVYFLEFRTPMDQLAEQLINNLLRWKTVSM